MAKTAPSATNGKAKRHRVPSLRDNLQAISRAEIRHAARRSGVKRIAGVIYDDIWGILREYLERIIPDAALYVENAQCKTITAMGVVHALKRNGTMTYGFRER